MRNYREAIELIKKWEGLRLHAYQDGGGVWTIGWGHTKNVHKGMEISREEAIHLLAGDMAERAQPMEHLCKVSLNDHEASALLSLVFNIGLHAFEHSTLLRVLNLNERHKCADEFLKWDHDNGKVVPGLLARRHEERALFLKPMPEVLPTPLT